ncbi:uncharacterized protein LOC127846918 [Dreissena polymorpha]|uniref:uncharacterized protein LOC127846918 n=1 Tax=Dreissena polymorpha TaxID=45954 RepID=UPI002264D9FE|nr:uncharacterized protein LOC127846918 [Dreissena polymorpha]
MAAQIRISILFCAVCVLQTYGQLDTSVCTGFDPSPNDPAFPTLPNSFEVHEEVNIKNRQFTSDYHMWYDYNNSIVAMHMESAGVRTAVIYNFNTRQSITTDRDTHLCTVRPLDINIPQFRIFGTMVNGVPTLLNPNQMLRFHDGAVRNKYINQTSIRGILCDWWSSCYYDDSLKRTMRVDWYYSAASWTTSTLNQGVPVRAFVVGKVNITPGKPRSFNHMYEFSDFKISLNNGGRNLLMTPVHAYCGGQKSFKPLPNPTSAFHFTAEIVNPYTNTIDGITEHFNDELQLGRYDYISTTALPYGLSSPLTEIHDFSTGVAYITDRKRGNCTAVPIESLMFDVKNVDGSHVRIRTSKEFFYFDNTTYIYEGQRVIRDVLCDVWIAQRTDWPLPGAGINSTWEWAFATPQYSENLANQLQFANPIQLYIDGGPNSGIQFFYNIYDYDERRPSIWSYDISTCYNYKSRQDFSYLIGGNYDTLVAGNLENFRYANLRALVKAGTVNGLTLSSLRIYNIQADKNTGTSISVTFTLLDKAPNVGDVTKPVQENDLSTVANAISNTINSGQMIVTMKDPSTNQPVTLTAQMNKLVQTQKVTKVLYYRNNVVTGPKTSSGSSGGAMAGMGVALLVVFFIGGVLVMYFFYRKQGGAFGPKKFDNQDITESSD